MKIGGLVDPWDHSCMPSPSCCTTQEAIGMSAAALLQWQRHTAGAKGVVGGRIFFVSRNYQKCLCPEPEDCLIVCLCLLTTPGDKRTYTRVDHAESVTRQPPRAPRSVRNLPATPPATVPFFSLGMWVVQNERTRRPGGASQSVCVAGARTTQAFRLSLDAACRRYGDGDWAGGPTTIRDGFLNADECSRTVRSPRSNAWAAGQRIFY